MVSVPNFSIQITSGGLFEVAMYIILIAGFAYAGYKIMEMWVG
jgi:hypothetical protein